jgi:hydroxypyruvate reductase
MSLDRVFAAALRACDPARATEDVLQRAEVRALMQGQRKARPVFVAAIGKAAATMAAATRNLRLYGGVVVVPDNTRVSLAGSRFQVLRAGHPVPDARSEAAGRALLDLAARDVPPEGVLLALISGGASSLAAVPKPGLTLAEKVKQTQALAAQGATIQELNALRTSLSAIKGGQLAKACAGKVITLVLSDVVGDDLSVVGSGPTVPCDLAILVSGVATLAKAGAAAVQREMKMPARIVDDALTGDVAVAARSIVAAIKSGTGPEALVWSGETTIALPPRPGRGGRARQLALTVARELAGVARWSLLAAGSDGIDGTDDAAGAIVDGNTWAAVRAAGIDPDDALARYDAGTALAKAGCAVVTGPTGVNHADLMIAVLQA